MCPKLEGFKGERETAMLTRLSLHRSNTYQRDSSQGGTTDTWAARISMMIGPYELRLSSTSVLRSREKPSNRSFHRERLCSFDNHTTPIVRRESLFDIHTYNNETNSGSEHD